MKNRNLHIAPNVQTPLLLVSLARLSMLNKAMENLNTAFLHLVNDPPRSSDDPMVLDVADRLYNEVIQQSWCSPERYNSLRSMTPSIVLYLIKQLRDSCKNNQDYLKKNIESLTSNFATSIFIFPAIVAELYSLERQDQDPFVLRGVDLHCSIIRKAVTYVVHRYKPTLSSMSLAGEELTEELWGIVLEEVVQSMTDVYARLWKKGCADPILIPSERKRNRRKGFIHKASLSQDGKYFALARSDHEVWFGQSENQEILKIWDISTINNLSDHESIPSLYLNHNASHVAIELDSNQVAVLSLHDEDQSIEYYNEEKRERFLRDFGIPFIPSLEQISPADYLLPYQAEAYLQDVFDWSCDRKGAWLLTASEKSRRMPEWMIDGGFERSVYHIARMRMIDLIRKKTHIDYICWSCGTPSLNRNETHCRECGTDFSLCPIGCSLPEDEALSQQNNWQCPHCNMPSRITHSNSEVEITDFISTEQPEQRLWERQHDIERVLNALKKISIPHKDYEIACDQLVQLKAEGKTNEEIGSILQIPRGSVDYVWSQCRKEILKRFPEI